MRSSTALIVVGIVVLVLGLGVAWSAYARVRAEDRPPMRSEPEEVVPGVRNDLGAWLKDQDARDAQIRRKARAAQEALPVMVGGGVVAVVGLALVLVGLLTLRPRATPARLPVARACPGCGLGHALARCPRCGAPSAALG